jgi:uncharacterized membrane protein YdjX (TVP38/TMEM64 family)
VLFKLAVAVALLIAAAIWLVTGNDLKALVRSALEFLRATGPAPFFLAMALLPLAGFPMSVLCLIAGSVFAPQLGMPLVIALALLAIGVNITLGYGLASRALRPLLSRMLQRLGYRLPQVEARDVTDLIVLLRVTPGIPFPVQNYLLGLAAVPFPKYLAISCLIAFPLNSALIFFGDALLQGRGRLALLGLLILVALLTAIHLVRRHYRARQAAPG